MKLFPAPDPTAPKVSYLQKMVALFVVALLMWVLWGRDGGNALTNNASTKAPSPRVASLSPAITDSLVALGLEAHIVGRSGYCKSVDESIPVVGDLRDFDAERLALIAPDVLFVQPPLAGVDPALRDYCSAKNITLVARRIDSLSDLRALVDDIERVFASARVSAPLSADVSAPLSADGSSDALATLLNRNRALLAPPPPLAPDAPRVLCVVSVDPFLAIGRACYLDEMLRGAGLANILEENGYLELSTEQLLLLKPDAIIGVSMTNEGAAKIEAAMRGLPWSGGAPKVAARAVPQLLSPSLAALAARDELARLAAEAK